MAAEPLPLAEEARRPLQCIPSMLQAYEGSNAAPVFAAVASHFDSRFAASPEAFMQVPVLAQDTAESLPSNSLVRFRGMVVDMFNPEFFCGAVKAAPGAPWVPAGLYTDDAGAAVDAGAPAAATAIMERRPLLLTPVPHEAGWAGAVWAGRPVEPATPRATMERAKRTREPSADPQPGGPADGQAGAPGALSHAQASKAARVAAAASGDAARGDAACRELDAHPTQKCCHDQDGHSRQQRQQQQAAAAAAAADDEHAQQMPSYQPGDCIVQVYGDADRFRLHDVVEVLGVLSVLPGLAALHLPHAQQRRARGGAAADGQAGDDVMDADAGADVAGGGQAAGAGAGAGAGDGAWEMEVDDFWAERAAALPPTSQVMRLHALVVRPAPAHPLAVPRSPAGGHLAAQLLRERALALLAAPLGGDQLAAEYLLLTALGTVVNRDVGSAQGLLPLNLTHVPPSSGAGKGAQVVPGLAAALHALLPHVALLPLSVCSLNSRRWYPQQSAASGRLLRGCLQLPEGCLLLLDESSMAAGSLSDAGVRNLQALEQVLVQQQLPCCCQVYTQSLRVNLPAVLLSQGRSVLRDHLALQLPLQPARPSAGADAWAGADVAGPDAIASAAESLSELAAVRQYLAAARGAQCLLDQAAAEACVARFRQQQAADPTLGVPELNNIITLAKLLSVSLGHSVFSIDSWERVVQMEAARKQRVTAAAAAAQQQR